MKTEDQIERNQEVFRKLIAAMSRPGELSAPNPKSKEPLMDVLNVLLDHEVSFCIAGRDNMTLESAIISETGSKKEDISKADFVIAPAGNTGDELYEVKRGSLEYPDGGATIIYYVADHDANKKSAELTFRGPGIAPGTGLFDPGIDAGELKKILEINSEYPLGVDTIIIKEKSGLMCIPRSIKIAGRM
jgi:alpha-D-ribose 1-methylphosphonate 5-triphosphate synthase subunit PhnH